MTTPYKSPPPDFENEYYYQYAESLGSSSTSSTTFQNKITLSTPVLPAGKYRIGWTYQFSVSAADRRAEHRVQYDSTNVWTSNPEESRKDYYVPVAGSLVVTFSTSDSHSITLDYRCDNAASTAIQNAALEIWRVN